MFKYNIIIDKKLNKNETITYEKKSILSKLELLNESWNINKERKLIDLLNEDFELKNKKYKFKYYLITRPRSGYDRNKKHIYITIHIRDISMTIAHEIHHIFFMNNFRSILEKKYSLSEKQIGELKEIMIFMINQKKYKKIVLVKDNTYKDIAIIQSKMSKIWNKRNDFNDFLGKAVKLYLKTYY
jgi:hypothetical protein